jgi:hypothetical protein
VQAQASNWEGGQRRGPPRLLLAVLVVVLVVGGCVALSVSMFTSPAFRVMGEIYEGNKSIVNRTHYSQVVGQPDRLAITMARDVSRAEALRFQCERVLPLMVREHVSAELWIYHPDGDYILRNEPCR